MTVLGSSCCGDETGNSVKLSALLSTQEGYVLLSEKRVALTYGTIILIYTFWIL